MELLAGGRLNRVTGWVLLLVGLAAAAILDPWFFSVREPSMLVKSFRPFVRHAQGVTLAMAFLQLAMADVLASESFPHRVRRTVALLSASGAVLYAAGYALGVFWPACLWAVLCGSLLNLCGFLFLVWVGPSGRYAYALKLGLCVVCFGMFLDLLSGLAATYPHLFMPAYLGAEDGVRLRMLRLARVAVIALCVLTLLYQGLAQQETPHRRFTEWGRLSLLCGTIGMPTVLAAACLSWTQLKYLLPIPATATVFGILVAVGLAWRQGRVLERAGWLMILASLSGGLVMGLYAFDGPFPTPEFLGDYNEFARRLVRLAHSYCVVLGMLAIFVARELVPAPGRTGIQGVGMPLLVVGGIVTIAVMLLHMQVQLPESTLGVGPGIVTIATLMCIFPNMSP